jgi:hypothetical protein
VNVFYNRCAVVPEMLLAWLISVEQICRPVKNIVSIALHCAGALFAAMQTNSLTFSMFCYLLLLIYSGGNRLDKPRQVSQGAAGVGGM